jgi:AcrR family transcriptional regulator
MFWRRGFVRASLDDIADEAKVTKRTLYQHFRSKDDLMAAVLLQASELSIEKLRRYFEQPHDSPVEFLDALFKDLAQWAARPRWMGAGFTRVAIELADLPGHPARIVARRHKQTMEGLFVEILDDARLPSPEDRAREIMLLWEGAMTLTLIHGDHRYIPAAAVAARRLVETGSGKAPRSSGAA